MFDAALVNLYTHDIEAGIRFYRDLLGFVETFRTPSDGVPEHVELRLNGFTIGLGTVEAARDVHGVEAAPGSPAMVLVVWTDDVDEAYRELAAAGVPTVQPPHDTGNNNRNALLRDPDLQLPAATAIDGVAYRNHPRTRRLPTILAPGRSGGFRRLTARRRSNPASRQSPCGKRRSTSRTGSSRSRTSFFRVTGQNWSTPPS
jgi:lactoylglutathione lyase